jgi:hypothetical protein
VSKSLRFVFESLLTLGLNFLNAIFEGGLFSLRQHLKLFSSYRFCGPDACRG